MWFIQHSELVSTQHEASNRNNQLEGKVIQYSDAPCQPGSKAWTTTGGKSPDHEWMGGDERHQVYTPVREGMGWGGGTWLRFIAIFGHMLR